MQSLLLWMFKGCPQPQHSSNSRNTFILNEFKGSSISFSKFKGFQVFQRGVQTLICHGSEECLFFFLFLFPWHSRFESAGFPCSCITTSCCSAQMEPKLNRIRCCYLTVLTHNVMEMRSYIVWPCAAVRIVHLTVSVECLLHPCTLMHIGLVTMSSLLLFPFTRSLKGPSPDPIANWVIHWKLYNAI